MAHSEVASLAKESSSVIGKGYFTKMVVKSGGGASCHLSPLFPTSTINSTLSQLEEGATFLDILKSFFRPTLVRV